MANPTKIFELKGQDFMKGLSIQSGLALGGLYSAAIGFDPFETMGYFKSGLYPVQIDGTTISTQVNFLASGASGGEGYVFAMGDRSGTGAKCFYRIKMSDSTVTDYSDKIDQVTTTGAVQHNGMTVYKSRVVYAHESAGAIYSNSLTPTVVADTLILSSANVSLTGHPVVFGVGSDGNLYYTAVGGAAIGKIVSVTSTSGNSAAAFSFTDTSLIPKDICNDGIYTIFIADNNGAGGGIANTSLANTSCRVFFWDTIKSKADIIYDIPESYLISCRYVDGKVLILGSQGLWACNSATPPKLIFPLTSSKLPTHATQVTTQNNILYWAGTAQGAGVFAYGSKIGNSILFNPFRNGGSDNLHTALVASGTYFVTASDAGTNTPKVYLHNSGSTRSGATLLTATKTLDQTYSISYVKVTLKAPLGSGDSIVLALYNGNGQVIMDSTTKSYAQDGAKQTLVFQPKSASGSFSKFEDIFLSITVVDDATVQRVSVYGVPLSDDNTQVI